MTRFDGRRVDELRPVSIETGFLDYAEGSALVTWGGTRVLCAASIETAVPGWLAGRGKGWVTGEYAMLPRSTHTRTSRERTRTAGRTQEIKRLIGRSLRTAVDLDALGERMIVIDCDVLQADGGTRTASITGGYVALALALGRLIEQGDIPSSVFSDPVAAVSVGIIDDVAMLDLNYREDSAAQVDMNVVMDRAGRFIEVQGTGEKRAFARDELDRLLDLAHAGIEKLFAAQANALGWELTENAGGRV